ncbi:MAG: P-loop NTPase, partial [Oscillospiraceae bacterium]
MSETNPSPSKSTVVPEIKIKKAANPIPKEAPHQLSKIKKVIGVVSGKGGVGKSLVTSLLAVNMNRLGYKTAIMDADITGPSIPRA